MFEIKLEGDWRKVGRQLKILPGVLKSAALEGQEIAAKKIVKIVKQHINKQDLGWVPRSENTHSADSRILVDTKDYLKAITSFRKYNTHYAGVPSTKRSRTGVRIADYALYNEFGFGKVPARPLWGPSLEELGGFNGVNKIIFNHLLKRVRALK